MRFLLDQGLARSAVQHLRQVGIESVHECGLGMAAASDATILEEGLKRNAVVVTLDADFYSLLALSNATQTTNYTWRGRQQSSKTVSVPSTSTATQSMKYGLRVEATRLRVSKCRKTPLADR